MKHKLLLVAVAAAMAFGMSVSAEAAPVSPSAPIVSAVATPGSAHLTLVRDGCGRGFHRNGRGFCRPNFRRFHHRRFRRCFVRRTPFGPRRVCRVY